MPALPVLGAAAKFLMANGARAATMKFGKAAVDKAKDQIKKRDAAIGDKASKANIGVKRTQKPESTRKMQDTKRDTKMAKEETARRSEKSDLLRPPKDEAPLRFKKGGTMKKKSKGYAKGGMKTKGMKRGGMKSKGMAKGGMKAKGMARGGMKSKGMAKGGMKAKGMAKGGMKAKGMNKGGKLRMVEKNGKMVPFYAADGVGKMKAGGMKSKGYAKGGMKSKMASKGGAKGGKKRVSKPKVRGAGIARKGVRPVKYR